MSHIDIGVSALRAAQVGLNTTAQNIANASTDGYHRQRVELVARRNHSPNLATPQGGGVDVGQLTRLQSRTVEGALTANISGQAATLAQLESFQQIEQALTPAEGSIHSLVTDFFDHMDRLAANPVDSILRRELVSTTHQLTEAVSQLATVFSGFNGGIHDQISEVIDSVNTLAESISRINRQIRISAARGQSDNVLLDQRDKLVNELATYVDIDPTSRVNGSDPIIAAGGALHIGEGYSTLSADIGPDGRIELYSSTGLRGFDVRGGKLGGLIDSSRAVQFGIGADFQNWATQFVREVDTIQATGTGLDGPVSALAGQRRLVDPDLPLASAEGLFALTSGELSITVTDASEQRTTTYIPVDAATDSLRDVVDRLDAVAGVSADIADDGTVSLQADSGFAFDFSGQPDQSPTTSSIAGSATPTVSGRFQGSQNSTLNLEVISGGQIGVTSDLVVRISDSETGRIVGDIDFGLGYPANGTVPLTDGIQLAISPGTLNTGDSFTIRTTGQPDETGLLAALGLGTLFAGNSLENLRLNADVVDAEATESSGPGVFGDSRQLDRLADLRTRPIYSPGMESIEERLASITGLSGILVASQQSELGMREARQLQLENARDSVSGVDPNEELLEMLQYQRAFQAASRFVTSIDETLDDLMRLIG